MLDRAELRTQRRADPLRFLLAWDERLISRGSSCSWQRVHPRRADPHLRCLAAGHCARPLSFTLPTGVASKLILWANGWEDTWIQERSEH